MAKKKKDDKKFKLILSTIGILVLAILIVAGVLLSMGPRDNDDKNTEGEVATTTEEAPEVDSNSLESGDSIIEKVKKLIILPDEEAVLIVIRNSLELKKQQAFYRFAEDGDYLVVLPISRIAIIYNANKNVLASVGPIQGDLSDLFGTGTTTTPSEAAAELEQ